jgi:hypothetical protein
MLGVTIQVLKSAEEAIGKLCRNEIPKMASKLPRGSNVTSQQIGQIADSMTSAE